MEIVTLIVLNILMWGLIVKIVKENEKRKPHFTP